MQKSFQGSIEITTVHLQPATKLIYLFLNKPPQLAINLPGREPRRGRIRQRRDPIPVPAGQLPAGQGRMLAWPRGSSCGWKRGSLRGMLWLLASVSQTLKSALFEALFELQTAPGRCTRSCSLRVNRVWVWLFFFLS